MPSLFIYASFFRLLFVSILLATVQEVGQFSSLKWFLGKKTGPLWAVAGHQMYPGYSVSKVKSWKACRNFAQGSWQGLILCLQNKRAWVKMLKLITILFMNLCFVFCSKWKADKHGVRCIELGPKGDTLLSAGRSIKLWDLETKENLRVRNIKWMTRLKCNVNEMMAMILGQRTWFSPIITTLSLKALIILPRRCPHL